MWDMSALRKAQGFASTTDLAKLFDVSRFTIYKWAKSGKIPLQRRYAGRIGWDMDELRKYIGITKAKPTEEQNEME